MKDMNWIQRKIYLYNVTFGLFMLDWWERFLFNTMVVVLMWFVFYNWSRYVSEFFRRSEEICFYTTPKIPKSSPSPAFLYIPFGAPSNVEFLYNRCTWDL